MITTRSFDMIADILHETLMSYLYGLRLENLRQVCLLMGSKCAIDLCVIDFAE